MLKKLIILSTLITAVSFADSKSQLEIKEDRIELELNQNIKTTKGRYDVDLSETSANIQLEVKSTNVKKDKNYNEEAEQVFTILKSNGIDDIHFSVEEDKMIGEDEIIFHKASK